MQPMRIIGYVVGSALIATGLIVAAQRPSEDPLRIAIARFQHETCTFCPGGDTEVEDWTRLRASYDDDELLDADGYIRGFVARAHEYGDVELIGLESPANVFGGSSASWNTEAAFDHFMNLILTDLRASMPVDGVYLALHGAMAVRNIPRPEAEIARRVREVVGPDVPIVGTFDLHGNEDEEFLRWANMAFVTKRFPHYDAYGQGERAARMLIRTMRGEFTPTTATRSPGIITATVHQWTGQSPSMDIMERARRWEVRENDVYVSLFYGFPWSDVPDVGATVMVTTNGDQALADHIADDMSEYMWRVRDAFASGEFPKPTEGVVQVRQAVRAGATPVAVGDYSDRNGDATHILRQLMDQGVRSFLYGTLRDEGVIDALVAQGATAGDAFAMDVGGFAGPSSGTPVRLEGTLAYFGEFLRFDHTAVVEFGDGNTIVITPALVQITEPEALAFGPIRPDDFDVFVVKSRAHFRRGFDETGYAPSIIIIDAPEPYVGTTRLDALDYHFAPIDKLYPFGMPDGR